MKLVIVEWLDSHSVNDWEKLEKLKKDCRPVLCRSVGWLLSKKNGHTLLVPHIAGIDNSGYGPLGSGNMTIPNRSIIKTRVLEE